MDHLRIRLIERLCRLPASQLSDVEALLVRLERAEAGNACPEASSGPSRPLVTPQKDWPHAPLHRLSEHGTFIITASTLHKGHFFRGHDRLTLLEEKRWGLPDSTTWRWKPGRCFRFILCKHHIILWSKRFSWFSGRFGLTGSAFTQPDH